MPVSVPWGERVRRYSLFRLFPQPPSGGLNYNSPTEELRMAHL